jgi:hypothetical protein
MNFDQTDCKVGDYASYGPKGCQVYFARCWDYLRRRHEPDIKPNFAYKQLCDGPIESCFAPFYLAWHMGLLPAKDGVLCEDVPLFYEVPLTGFDKAPTPTAEFIEIMVDLLEGKTRREAMTMIIEFHDFLAVRAPEQALRFVTEIVEDYTSRFAHPTLLLCLKGEHEHLDRSCDFAQTLHCALHSVGILDSSIAVLTQHQISSAYRRLKWDELANLASENDRVAVLSTDLGL